MDGKKGNIASIRLSAHQDLLLDEISKKIKIDKTKILRFALDQFLEKYERSVANEKQL